MKNENLSSTKIEQKKKACGIIMPIAPHPDYPSDHWKDVYQIICESLSDTEFETKLVSEDDAIGLIHDRIVTNIYNNEIIVCDVSTKNPNVMFELGMRLAFDKPTIIIKDERTGFSFDTGVIEHLSYPSSLRFGQIVIFKQELKKRILATYEKSTTEKEFSPFLKSFGKTIKPANIHHTEISEGKYIIDELDKLRSEIRSLRQEPVLSNDLRIRKSILNENDLVNSYISKIIKNYKYSNDQSDKVFNTLSKLVAAELMERNISVSDEEITKRLNVILNTK